MNKSDNNDKNYELKINWLPRMTAQFIESYKRNNCLWDRGCPGYRNRNKREQALEEIASEFDTSVTEVKRKIHNLRNQFNQEFLKIIKSHKEGGDYESKWIHFQALKFIVTGNTASRNNYVSKILI